MYSPSSNYCSVVPSFIAVVVQLDASHVGSALDIQVVAKSQRKGQVVMECTLETLEDMLMTHEIKGEGICCYVCPMTGYEAKYPDEAALIKDLRDNELRACYRATFGADPGQLGKDKILAAFLEKKAPRARVPTSYAPDYGSVFVWSSSSSEPSPPSSFLVWQ